MIVVYKRAKQIKADNLKYEMGNDIFFNKYTAEKLNEKASQIIEVIDGSKMVDRFSIISRFDGNKLSIDKLSTGCKTVLNIMYNPDVVFDLRECGDNALDVIYSLEAGNVFCDYPMISVEMKTVIVGDETKKIINGYDELLAWWSDEE